MFVVLGPAAAIAAASGDPAAARADAFDDALLATMKQGSALGFQGRVRRLAPAVEQNFNLRVMAQFAVGPPWSTLKPAEQAEIVSSLTKYTVARYAHDFDSYADQRFLVDPVVQTRGLDKLVKTQIIAPRETPVTLSYRMREYGGSWKAIDVYYKGVSQLTTQRADFASSIAKGGAAALVKKLDALTASLR